MTIKAEMNLYELAQKILLLKLKQDSAQHWKYLAVKEDLADKRAGSHILEEFVKEVAIMAEKMEAGTSPNAFMTPEMKKAVGIIETPTSTVEDCVNYEWD